MKKSLYLKTLFLIIFLGVTIVGSIKIYFNVNDIPIYDIRLAYNFMFNKNKISQYENLSELLGFNKDDKLLILHADDLGLSESVNLASFDALSNGYVNSASVMIPAPKTIEVANYFKDNPNADLGLHLTFTAEWKNYKWSGISPNDSIPSLINNKGDFFEKKKTFTIRANPLDVKKELQAQIDYAKSIGINPTHLDSHEGALFYSPEFFKIYIEVGNKNKLPVFVPQVLAPHFNSDFLKPNNLVVVNKMYMADKNVSFEDWSTYYIDILNNLNPGLNEIIVHLGYDDNEMQEITSQRIAFGSKWRNLDYAVVSSPEFKKVLTDNNIKLVTWKQIKNLLYPTN
ncbi:MAG: putative glycoside hydrolase/deacetylase ChbG (UPF0249 family) [Candidatus Marivariicella framensis]|jgi:predicted glycoside hydrolase/deacetylase ChbG (UPF0249 family)|tara:strand:- start:797 stop:1822 length:1026 start_codon:yes stop_codon:yes gene_type:complete